MKAKAKDPRVPYGHKRCCRCKVPRPKTTDHFHRDSKAKDGLSSRCKGCERERQDARKATTKYREWFASYSSTEAYKKARRDYAKKHGTESRRRYLDTPLGRAVNQRVVFRCRLKKCSDPARREELQARIEELDRVIEVYREKRDMEKAKAEAHAKAVERAVAEKSKTYVPRVRRAIVSKGDA